MRANHSSRRARGKHCLLASFALPVALLFLIVTPAFAADLATARKEFIAGQYAKCIALCEEAIADREYEEEWRSLLVRSLSAVGKYEQAGGGWSTDHTFLSDAFKCTDGVSVPITVVN